MKTTHKEMLLASLEKFNTCEVVVGGTSMWPFIREGDTVSIKQKPFKPSLGKVVAFFAGDQLITHRIIWYKQINYNNWLLTIHGDASPFSLSQINTDEVIGTIRYLKRKNRKITFSLNYPYRIIAIPIGIVLQFVVAIKLLINRK